MLVPVIKVFNKHYLIVPSNASSQKLQNTPKLSIIPALQIKLSKTAQLGPGTGSCLIPSAVFSTCMLSRIGRFNLRSPFYLSEKFTMQ